MAMELQLGLALPAYNPTKLKSFDLNNFDFRQREEAGKSNTTATNKRGFEEAFGGIRDNDLQSGMMPLLVWSGQPNEEDDQKGQKKRTSSPISQNEQEEKLVVGWPPIQSWRRKFLHQQQQQAGQVGRVINNNRMGDLNNEKENGVSSNSMFVKVKMEGVAIARKINLKRYHSFYTLKNSLIAMFSKHEKCNRPGVRYALTYQDKEGDWLLVEDVPWQTFMESVQRLQIVKRGG